MEKIALPAPYLMPDLTEFMTTQEAAQKLGFSISGCQSFGLQK